MSKIKKVCVSIAMAVVLLFGGVFSFFGANNLKTKAVSSEYAHQEVYYFNDAYPSLTHCSYMAAFSDMPFYEYQQVDEYTFYEMAHGDGDFASSYFSDIAYDAVVIIDIKTFLPDDGALCTLFSGLKENSCTTAFISVYSSDNFSESTLENIDYFYQSNLSNMEYFIDGAIRNFTERIDVISEEQDGLENACIILDQSWVSFQGEGDDVFVSVDVPFFMEILTRKIKVYTSSSLSDDTYGVLQDNNIHLLVYTGDNASGAEFIDVVSGEVYNVTQLNELFDEDILQFSNPQATPIEADYMCFIGCRALDPLLHNMLKVKQDAVGAYYLPVYTYERTHVEFGADGLVMITEKDLWEMYHREERNEEYYIIEEFGALL